VLVTGAVVLVGGGRGSLEVKLRNCGSWHFFECSMRRFFSSSCFYKKMLVLRFAGVEEQKREEDKMFFTIFWHCISIKLNTCAELVYNHSVQIFPFFFFF
jgi:hypothetical protein